MSASPAKGGGYDCRTPQGRSLWSREPMDHADLVSHDAMMGELEALPAVDEDDTYYAEDQDADGYGWERHALVGAYGCP